MNVVKCFRGHEEPKEGCPSCQTLARNPKYRDALAKRQGLAPETPPPPPRKCKPPAPCAPLGVGGHMKAMLRRMGVPPCQSCNDFARQMDHWGVEGCKAHRAEILERLHQKAKTLGWFKWVKAGMTAAVAGLPLTPEGLLDEAIRRTEAGTAEP